MPKELEVGVIGRGQCFQTFYHVALPLARPGMATLASSPSSGSPTTLARRLSQGHRQLQTLPPGLATLATHTSEIGLMMAGP